MPSRGTTRSTTTPSTSGASESRSSPPRGRLSILRVGLILALIVHVYSAFALWSRAKRARTTPYVMKKRTGATWASLLMRWGGVTLLLFIVWHLLNFTIGKVNVQGGPTDDPYNLLVDTFDVWWLTLIYLVAMLMLGAHLHHGFWSACQTLGWTGTARARHDGEDHRVHPGADHRGRLQPGPARRARRHHREVRRSSMPHHPPTCRTPR